MEGNRWAQFYAFVDAYAYNGIEPFGGDSYLRPSYCRAYSATITPAAIIQPIPTGIMSIPISASGGI